MENIVRRGRVLCHRGWWLLCTQAAVQSVATVLAAMVQISCLSLRLAVLTVLVLAIVGGIGAFHPKLGGTRHIWHGDGLAIVPGDQDSIRLEVFGTNVDTVFRADQLRGGMAAKLSAESQDHPICL